MLIYFVITSSYNPGCLHCHTTEKNNGNTSLFDNIVRSFIEVLKQTDAYTQKSNGFTFVFHVGELLPVKEESILRVCETIKENMPDVKVKFLLQMPLTLINESVITLIKDCFDGSVNIPFDQEIRQTNISYPRFKFLWEKNVKYLREKGIHVTVNVALVGDTGRCISRFRSVVTYLKSLGIRDIHIEKFFLQGEFEKSKTLYIKDSEYFTFMNYLLDWYIEYLINWYRGRKTREDVVIINPLIQMLYLARFNRGASCFAGDCMRNVLTLDCNGDVYPCPVFLFSERKVSFGNVLKNNAEEILSNPKRVQLIIEQALLGCDGCEYVSFCHQGCPKQPFEITDRTVCRKFFKKLIDYSKRYKHIVDCLLGTF